MEILVPFKDEKNIPDYLVDFIQNDPNFVPEIHLNNLEDAFMSIHSNQTAGFEGNNIKNNKENNNDDSE